MQRSAGVSGTDEAVRVLPYRTFEVQTALRPEEVADKIAGSAEEARWWHGLFGFLRDAPRPFEGTVDGLHFDVARVIIYRNAFRPRLVGVVEASPTGSRIVGTMRLPALAYAFVCIWFGFVALACVATLIHEVVVWQFRAAALAPFGMLAAGSAFVRFAFVREARQGLYLLVEVTGGWSYEMR